MKYDVFISYSTKDQSVVEELCGYLETCGIRCFAAYRNIPRGVVWAEAIVEAMDASRMMVVVYSSNFNESSQVNRELELASEAGMPILTYRLDETVFKGAKRYYLKNLNWIDATPNPKQSFIKLAEGVAGLLNLKLKANVGQGHKNTTTSDTHLHSTHRKTKKWLWALALIPLLLVGLWFGLSGGMGNERYQIGDYYNGGECQGVVFEVDATGKHGKIVSLRQSRQYLHWCSEAELARKQNVYADDEYNGLPNQQKVQRLANWRVKYPAFAWCDDLGERWYLPAVDELIQIRKNKAIINATLAKVGGDALTMYWASTEGEYEGSRGWRFCAWYVDIEKDYANDVNKGYDFYVRAVATF